MKVWLEAIDALAAWMRKTGATHARIANGVMGEIEVKLGDKPHAIEIREPLTDEQAAKAFLKEKEELDELLFASSEGLPLKGDD